MLSPSQIQILDIRNADWDQWRYEHARRDELKEVEKKNNSHIKRSASAKEAWHERKTKK